MAGVMIGVLFLFGFTQSSTGPTTEDLLQMHQRLALQVNELEQDVQDLLDVVTPGVQQFVERHQKRAQSLPDGHMILERIDPLEPDPALLDAAEDMQSQVAEAAKHVRLREGELAAVSRSDPRNRGKRADAQRLLAEAKAAHRSLEAQFAKLQREIDTPRQKIRGIAHGRRIVLLTTMDCSNALRGVKPGDIIEYRGTLQTMSPQIERYVVTWLTVAQP